MARVAYAPVSSISPLASPSHSEKAVAMVTRTKEGRVRRKYERGERARENQDGERQRKRQSAIDGEECEEERGRRR